MECVKFIAVLLNILWNSSPVQYYKLFQIKLGLIDVNTICQVNMTKSVRTVTFKDLNKFLTIYKDNTNTIRCFISNMVNHFFQWRTIVKPLHNNLPQIIPKCSIKIMILIQGNLTILHCKKWTWGWRIISNSSLFFIHSKFGISHLHIFHIFTNFNLQCIGN